MSVRLEHYRGNEEFVKRLFDYGNQMERRKRVVVTPFFSPDQGAICEAVFGKQFLYEKEGGYPDAERCRYALTPTHATIDFQIATLRSTYSTQFAKVEHRDVLGAILNLGLEREKIGDLLVRDGEIIIFVDQEIENYIVCNLTRIKRCAVHFQPYEADITFTAQVNYEHKIVSSLRLDTLVSTFAKISRKKAQALIQAGHVKVNHVILEQTSYLCNNNSAISIRGYGRFQLKEIIKKTKKDHLVIEVGKYQ